MGSTGTAEGAVANTKVATLADGDLNDKNSLIVWLRSTEWVKGWSKTVMVLEGVLEPLTHGEACTLTRRQLLKAIASE